MKAIWSGSLSFGLVAIPIRLYSVAQEHVLGFKILCDRCNNPLKMKRWCDHCKKEVSWEHVVKGLELSKDEYFVVTQEAVKSLKPVKSSAITINAFITKDLIDPIYFNTHYYAAPAQKEKPYTLFQYALGASNKVALGSFVMRDREHVCIIESYHTGLLLTTLYYDYEIRPVANIAELQGQAPKISAPELKLAQQLIAQLTQTTFDIADYKDTFAQQLKKAIKQHKEGKIIKKSKGGKAVALKTKTTASLMNQLQASLKEEKTHAKRSR